MLLILIPFLFLKENRNISILLLLIPLLAVYKLGQYLDIKFSYFELGIEFFYICNILSIFIAAMILASPLIRQGSFKKSIFVSYLLSLLGGSFLLWQGSSANPEIIYHYVAIYAISLTGFIIGVIIVSKRADISYSFTTLFFSASFWIAFSSASTGIFIFITFAQARLSGISIIVYFFYSALIGIAVSLTAIPYLFLMISNKYYAKRGGVYVEYLRMVSELYE